MWLLYLFEAQSLLHHQDHCLSWLCHGAYKTVVFASGIKLGWCVLHLGWNISHFFFQFGPKALTALPGFITSSVHSVLFSLLAHPQLSIREHATKALSAILSRCEFEVRQSLHFMCYMLTRFRHPAVQHLLKLGVWARGSRQEDCPFSFSFMDKHLLYMYTREKTCYTQSSTIDLQLFTS